MENIVVVTFTDPSKAYQALSTVKELDASGRLALRSAAVVERQANGQPIVHDDADPMEVPGMPDGLVGNIVSFNVGVEIGQVVALTVILLAFQLWRRSGTFTRGARPGRTPLGVVFAVAAGDRPADRVPPQGSRWLRGYQEAEK